MNQPLHYLPATLLIVRCAFGGLFLWASFGKIIDPERFAQQVANYQIIGTEASAVVGAILPWAEFVFGTCLMLGLWAAPAWMGTMLLLGGFAAARASVLARGLSVECGCGVMDGTITPMSLCISIALFLIALAGYLCTFRARIRFHRNQSRPNSAPRENQIEIRICQRISMIGFMILLSDWSLPPASAAPDAQTKTATAIRRSACRDMQSEFDRTIAADADQKQREQLSWRLDAMDRVTAAVLNDLRLHQSALVNQSLATVGESNEQTRAEQFIGSAKIVAQYQSHFDGSVVPAGLKAADSDVIQRYFQSSSESLTAYIQSSGRACMTVVGADRTEIVRLSFVLEMLTSDQNQKLMASSPALPAWMRRPEALRTLQDFAAESERPRMAFELSRQSDPAAAPADLAAAYFSFVKQTSDSLLRKANYQAAVACLRDGVGVAISSKDDLQATELSLHLAEILEKAESPAAAAEEMARLQSIGTDSSTYGRACMLRLKYLLEAGDAKTAMKEATSDVNEPRCAGSLPEIMYIAWLASRRQGTDAEWWRKRFLQQYPDHPLAAQMYYAQAVDAIAQDRSEEAARLLQFILDRFPQSSIIDKVRQIQRKLVPNSATSQE